MTPLLSVLNTILFLATTAFILQLGRKRCLSERSSLSCLAAASGIYLAFQSSAIWNLLTGYEARFVMEHIFFLLSWSACAAFVLICVKLTDFSRMRRTLIQDLALLEAETGSAPEIPTAESVREKVQS